MAGCTATLSSCVVWDGSPLPGLAICKGDSLTVVITKLVSYLQANSSVVDLKSLDLHCLTSQPASFQELLQQLVKAGCEKNPDSTEERYCAGDAAVYYDLPESLHYTDELTGEVTTQLTPKAYAEYVAGSYSSLHTQHEQMQRQLKELSAQYIDLQRTVRTLSC